MKKTIYKMLLPALFLAALSVASVDGISQNRKLPDGTIVYPDGSRKLPNGTVINKRGTVTRRNRDVRLPGGQVVWRDQTNRNDRRRDARRNNGGQWMPPGQAKKVYGGSARDYAPGQQKKWNKNKNRRNHDYDERDDDHEGRRGKHDGKGYKDHKDKDD